MIVAVDVLQAVLAGQLQRVNSDVQGAINQKRINKNSKKISQGSIYSFTASFFVLKRRKIFYYFNFFSI